MNGEKRYIPGTNPKWGRELPDGDLNSLVDAAGNPYDNGYNFDEKDDDKGEEELKRDLGAVAGKALTEEETGPGAGSSTPETA